MVVVAARALLTPPLVVVTPPLVVVVTPLLVVGTVVAGGVHCAGAPLVVREPGVEMWGGGVRKDGLGSGSGEVALAGGCARGIAVERARG